MSSLETSNLQSSLKYAESIVFAIVAIRSPGSRQPYDGFTKVI